MTINRYKFLGAMLALRDRFTLDDLTRYCELNEATVRTLFSREQHRAEFIEKVETGRPGGKLNLYKVKAEAITALEAELGTIYFGHPIPPIEPSTELQAPLSLVTAEDTLGRRLRQATTVEERARLVELARLLLETTRDEVNALVMGIENSELASSLTSRVHRLEKEVIECAQELATINLNPAASSPPNSSSASSAIVQASPTAPPPLRPHPNWRALLVSPNRQTAADLVCLLSKELPDMTVVHSTVYPNATELSESVQFDDPLICFLEVASDPDRAALVLECLHENSEQTKVVAMLRENDPDLLFRFLKAGADEVLIRPFSEQQFDPILKRLDSNHVGRQRELVSLAGSRRQMLARAASGARLNKPSMPSRRKAFSINLKGERMD